MQKYLTNLANIHALDFCKEHNIDCSGSYIHKYPQKQVYQLIKEDTKETLLFIQFHPSQTPTFTVPTN